jgi:hypothetical protein
MNAGAWIVAVRMRRLVPRWAGRMPFRGRLAPWDLEPGGIPQDAAEPTRRSARVGELVATGLARGPPVSMREPRSQRSMPWTVRVR